MAIRDWLKDLIRWIKKAIGLENFSSVVEILEEYHSDRVSVFRIKNDEIPGCCDFWKIEHHHERVTFWICCLNLAHLRTALAELGISQSAFLKTHHRGMAANIETQLREQSAYLASHYWICGITKPHQGIDPKGRHYQSFRTGNVRLIAGDFQGAAGTYAGDRYIQRFAREIAGRVANCEFREFAKHPTWISAVKAIDWLEWLQGISQGHKGIDPQHRLQVMKSSRLRHNQN